MAKIKPNRLLIQGISGTISGLVYYQDKQGNLIVQAKGERKRGPSQRQLARNEQFRLAAIYGNRVKSDPILSAEYRPACRGRMGPYQAAVRDFLTPPEILAIDTADLSRKPGGSVRISATDDTGVVSVSVRIQNALSGLKIEEGLAQPGLEPNEWRYLTTAEVTAGTVVLVEATAADRPGNTVSAKVELVIH